MRIDKIDLGHQSSGDREEPDWFQPLGTFFLTTREILTTHLADPWATWRRSAKERRTFSKHFLAFDAKTLLLGVCVWYVMRALCIVVAEDLYASGL